MNPCRVLSDQPGRVAREGLVVCVCVFFGREGGGLSDCSTYMFALVSIYVLSVKYLEVVVRGGVKFYVSF